MIVKVKKGKGLFPENGNTYDCVKYLHTTYDTFVSQVS